MKIVAGMLAPFRALPKGARFRYADPKWADRSYIALETHGEGKLADHMPEFYTERGGDVPRQALYCFVDDNNTLDTEVVFLG